MIRRLLFCAILIAPFTVLAQDHWVATWAASPQQFRPLAPPAPARAGQPAAPAAPRPLTSLNNQTVRMLVRTSIGGSRLRLQFSNRYGTAPLALGAAHVALHGEQSAIVSGSDHALSFDGKPAVTIPAGAIVISDPVDLQIPKLADLAVSVYIPGDSGQLTMHATGLHTTYIAEGNAAAAPVLSDTKTTQSWYFLSGVDV